MIILGLVIFITKFRKKPEIPEVILKENDMPDLNDTPIETYSKINHFKPTHDLRFESKNIIYRN